jgi:serine/threonine-protein kinase
MHDLLDRVTKALRYRFTIEREIGRGGMATVYRAIDQKHERAVAIKVLHPDLAASVGADRFLREIKLTARLNHPHILALLDSGDVDGLLYYAMPFVAGESLRDRLKREKQLPIRDALQIAREVTDALEHAHRHGVVHRDIKPDNVLLEDGHAVVADFGIARALSAATENHLTATGVTVGTPEYMSPEQAGGDAGLDGRSDIYAVGCLVYEMLAGQPPFTGVSAESVVRQHLAAEPRPISAMRAGIPQPVVAALQRALAKAPADRFASAREFGDALIQSPNVDATSARWATTHYRVVGLFGIAIVLAIVSIWRSGQTRRPTVVVRPFASQTSDTNYFYFANALQEELISLLGKIPNIRPIERASVLTVYERDTVARNIARQFRADFVVDGSVDRSTEQVKVSVRLFDPYTGKTLFQRPYVEPPSAANLADIQTDIAQRVADALEIRIDAEVRGRISGRPTENAIAYDMLHEASSLPFGYDITQNQRAETLLINASALDPKSPALRAKLAYVYAARAYSLGRPRRWADSALALARSALRDDSTLLAGFQALGFAHLELGHLDDARRAFTKALSLRPSDGQSRLFIGWLSFLTGDFTSAVQEWAATKGVDPMNPTVPGDMSLVEQIFGDVERARQWQNERRALQRSDNFGGFGRPRLTLLAGRPQDALREAQEQLGRDTGSYQARAVVAEMAIATDSFELAGRHFEAMNRIAPYDWTFWGTTPRTGYAYVLMRRNDTTEATELLRSTLDSARQLLRKRDQRAGVRREIAAIFAGLGERDSSLKWLDSARVLGWRHDTLQPSPWIVLAASRDSGFAKLLQKMHSDIDAMKQTIRDKRLGPVLPQR